MWYGAAPLAGSQVSGRRVRANLLHSRNTVATILWHTDSKCGDEGQSTGGEVEGCPCAGWAASFSGKPNGTEEPCWEEGPQPLQPSSSSHKGHLSGHPAPLPPPQGTSQSLPNVTVVTTIPPFVLASIKTLCLSHHSLSFQATGNCQR